MSYLAVRQIFRGLQLSGLAALALIHFGCGTEEPWMERPAQEKSGAVRPDTPGVFRSSNSVFYLRNESRGGFADVTLTYGAPGDHPLAGDCDGDGIDTIGVYRNGTFYLSNSKAAGQALPASGGPPTLVVVLGAPGDQPVVGDWDGDGVDTAGFYRDGAFYLRNSNAPGEADITVSLGQAGDIALAGDWNGDGTTTTGVFRPSISTFFLKDSNAPGVADHVATFGAAGDRPVIGDWDGDKTDTVGIYRNGSFHLRSSNTSGAADLTFAFGIDGDHPLAGDWDGRP
jgi:hypothetical protein